MLQTTLCTALRCEPRTFTLGYKHTIYECVRTPSFVQSFATAELFLFPQGEEAGG